ncbi:MAG: metal ABC transporter permease, partial [Planctomycetota bacterium]
GNLVLAPLDRWKVGELDLGPKSFVVMSAVLLVVLAFITLAFKELKLGVFDPVLAGKFGLRPGLLQSLWLMIVSITTVAAFNVAGSILIVSLMIAPPAAAYLLTDRLGWMLVVSAVIAIASAFGGYYLSTVLDISPTGPISSFAGLLFLCVFAAAPKRGLLAKWMLQKRGRRQTHELLVLAAVQHGGVENTDQLAIPQRCISRSIGQLERSGLIYAIQEKKGRTDFAVTEDGRLRLEQMFQDE